MSLIRLALIILALIVIALSTVVKAWTAQGTFTADAGDVVLFHLVDYRLKQFTYQDKFNHYIYFESSNIAFLKAMNETLLNGTILWLAKIEAFPEAIKDLLRYTDIVILKQASSRDSNDVIFDLRLEWWRRDNSREVLNRFVWIPDQDSLTVLAGYVYNFKDIEFYNKTVVLYVDFWPGSFAAQNNCSNVWVEDLDNKPLMFYISFCDAGRSNLLIAYIKFDKVPASNVRTFWLIANSSGGRPSWISSYVDSALATALWEVELVDKANVTLYWVMTRDLGRAPNEYFSGETLEKITSWTTANIYAVSFDNDIYSYTGPDGKSHPVGALIVMKIKALRDNPYITIVHDDGIIVCIPEKNWCFKEWYGTPPRYTQIKLPISSGETVTLKIYWFDLGGGYGIFLFLPHRVDLIPETLEPRSPEYAWAYSPVWDNAILFVINQYGLYFLVHHFSKYDSWIKYGRAYPDPIEYRANRWGALCIPLVRNETLKIYLLTREFNVKYEDKPSYNIRLSFILFLRKMWLTKDNASSVLSAVPADRLTFLLDPTYSFNDTIYVLYWAGTLQWSIAKVNATTVEFIRKTINGHTNSYGWGYYLAEKPFAYVVKGNYSDGFVHVWVPPSFCIEISNSTWSGRYCNLYPYKLPALEVKLSPGTYRWKVYLPFSELSQFREYTIKPAFTGEIQACSNCAVVFHLFDAVLDENDFGKKVEYVKYPLQRLLQSDLKFFTFVVYFYETPFVSSTRGILDKEFTATIGDCGTGANLGIDKYGGNLVFLVGAPGYYYIDDQLIRVRSDFSKKWLLEVGIARLHMIELYANGKLFGVASRVTLAYPRAVDDPSKNYLFGGVNTWGGVSRGYLGLIVLYNRSLAYSEVVKLFRESVFLYDKHLIVLLDASYNNDTHIFNLGTLGGAAEAVGLTFILTTRPFVYYLANFTDDGYAHLLIPPGVCIRVWNETWSMTFCNLEPVYPYLDVPISPGRYRWALGESDVVDIAYLPDTLLYSGEQVPIRQSASLLYPTATVGMPSELTILNYTWVSLAKYAYSHATSSLIATPITDLIKISELRLTVWLKVEPKVEAKSEEIPIVVVERSGRDLSNYPVKIVLTDANFKAWSEISCDRTWNPTTCNFWFTDTDGNPLCYWVMYFNATEKKAIVYVKIPHIPANGTVTILMRWGTTNPYSAYLSASKAGILLFDTFDTYDTSKWQSNCYGACAIIENGVLKLMGDWNKAWYFSSKVTVSPPMRIIYLARFSALGDEDFLVGIMTNPTGQLFSSASTPVGFVSDVAGDAKWNSKRIWYHGSDVVYDGGIKTTAWVLYKVWVFPDKAIFYDNYTNNVLQWQGTMPSGAIGLGADSDTTTRWTEVDWILVVEGAAYPEPMIYVNVTFGEVDVGLTNTEEIGTGVSRFVVAVRGGSVSNVSYVIVGSVWSKLAESPVLLNSWCVVNMTWVDPTSSGKVYVKVACGGYEWSWSGEYFMSGGLYIWVGFGSSLSMTNMTIGNITLYFVDTMGNEYSYRLLLLSRDTAFWTSSESSVIDLRAVIFPYSTMLFIVGNLTDYSIVYALSQTTRSSVTRMEFDTKPIAYIGVDRGVWLFSSQSLFRITPGLVYLKYVVPLTIIANSTCLRVVVPKLSGYSGLFLMGRGEGSFKLYVRGRLTSRSGYVKAYLLTPGSLDEVSVKLNDISYIYYAFARTTFGLYVRWKDAEVDEVTLCAASVEPLSLPVRIGYNSTIIAYVPAFLAVVNLTENKIVPASEVHSLVIELRDPSTGTVLTPFKLSKVNLIISPAPSVVLFAINGTLFIDFATLAGISFDAIPAKLEPITPITLYVTIDKAHWSSWQQPLYIAIIYDTGNFRAVVGTSFGYGAITSTGDLIMVQFVVEVPSYLVGSVGILVLESLKTGLVEMFPSFKITSNMYVTVTKTLEAAVKKIVIPIQPTPGKLPTVPKLPEEVVRQVLRPPALVPTGLTPQLVIVTTVIVGCLALALTRRMDIARGLILAGLILLLTGVPLLIYQQSMLWVMVVAGIISFVFGLVLLIIRPPSRG